MKKYIDTKEILNKPKQSLLEKWYEWVLKNAVVASMFAAIVSWVNKAVAEEKTDHWDISMGKVTESFQYSRKPLFIIGGLVLLILLILSVFKKLRWRWFFILVGLLIGFAIGGLVIDYMEEEYYSPQERVVSGYTSLETETDKAN